VAIVRNPFKKRFLVPIRECSERIIDIMVDDPKRHELSLDLFAYIEKKWGVKREWSWKTNTNYLVFNSEAEYTMFLLKL
jgi:hypothetical protein